MTSSLIYFSIGFITMTISTLSFSTKGNYIARTFYEMSPDVVANSIFEVGYYGIYKAGFDKPTLEQNVISYLNKNLKGYVSSYKIGFSYFSINYQGEYVKTWDTDPQLVDIEFSCKYNITSKFEGFIHFSVEGIYKNERQNY